MHNVKLFSILILSISFLAIACDTEDDPTTATLSLNFTGLEDLGSNYRYEGWIMVNGSPISAGIFSVNSNGVPSISNFELDADDLNAATAYILTIEPSPDNDPAPSDVHILAGDFSGNSASLAVNHAAALGNSFGSANGQYILATPTDSNMDNENSGVWWLDPSGPTATLDLPSLPSGWIYEGWAVINGQAISTGTFSSVSGADGSAIYSGPTAGPPFPGEDFLENAPQGLTFPTDLSGGLVVISVEPVPDNSAAPFTLKPLVGNVPTNAAVHSLLPMDNNATASNPTGVVSR